MRRATAVALGLFLAACGLSGVRAIRPGRDAPAERVADLPSELEHPPRVTQTPSDLDLEAFLPLLSETRFERVRALLDLGDATAAAKELESNISSTQIQGLDEVRVQYLFGVIARQAGDAHRALGAFGVAAASEWILAEDARLHMAELQIEVAKFSDAEAAVLALKKLKKSERAYQVLGASLSAQDRLVAAVDVYREWGSTASGFRFHLKFARALLDLAEASPAGPGRLALATEARAEAKMASVGLTPEHAAMQEVMEIGRRATASGAAQEAQLPVAARLEHVRLLLAASDFAAAESECSAIQLPEPMKFSGDRCELDYLRGKALAGLRRWGEGADRIGPSADNCTRDPQLHAWLLFNAGKYAAADGRDTKAIKYFSDLERLYPQSNLADDARLRAAQSYRDSGVAAQFISLLSSMPEDYPHGDMTMEGVLLLALSRIERGDWPGAAQVLERAATVVRSEDSSRGPEYSGMERYFLARARQEMGETERALAEYESIIGDVALSYYMLHAYSRLLEADPARAARALRAGLERATEAPFSFPHRPEYSTPEFMRGMELIRVGELERGQAILAELGLGEGADDALVWGIALLYDRAGDAHNSHGIARGRLTDWLAHYPEGTWRSPWEIGFPRPYLPIVERESKATGVPQWFLYGIMREESTFRPSVVSSANAYGLMQVIEPTARAIAKTSGHPSHPDALKRPSVNIAIGSRVLKELGRRFRDNPTLAIPGYNAGPGSPSKWLRERPNVDFDVWVEMIPYRETRRYTKRVLASRAAYAFLYYRQQAHEALVLPRRLVSP